MAAVSDVFVSDRFLFFISFGYSYYSSEVFHLHCSQFAFLATLGQASKLFCIHYITFVSIEISFLYTTLLYKAYCSEFAGLFAFLSMITPKYVYCYNCSIIVIYLYIRVSLFLRYSHYFCFIRVYLHSSFFHNHVLCGCSILYCYFITSHNQSAIIIQFQTQENKIIQRFI